MTEDVFPGIAFPGEMLEQERQSVVDSPDGVHIVLKIVNWIVAQGLRT
jgi:hypothetical protein